MKLPSIDSMPSSHKKQELEVNSINIKMAFPSLRKMHSCLSKLGFNRAHLSKNSLEIMSAQSFTLEGEPYNYFRAVFTRNNVKLEYTLSKSNDRGIRKLEAISWLLHLIDSSETSAGIPNELIAFICQGIDDAREKIAPSHERLIVENSLLKQEHSKLKKEHKRLMAEHEAQAKELISATLELEQAKAKLAKLAEISDDVLDELVLGWLRTHKGEINVIRFSASNKVLPSRVEQSLERLSKGGYIARI